MTEPPDSVFRALLNLWMASDPSPLTDENNGEVEDWLNEVARERGYEDWIQAYHDFEVDDGP